MCAFAITYVFSDRFDALAAANVSWWWCFNHNTLGVLLLQLILMT